MDVGIDGDTGGVKPKGCGWGCWGCLGVIALPVVMVAIFGLIGGGGSSNDADYRIVASERACHNAVRDSLKSPTSAQFSDTRVFASGSNYRVTGSVDAENSFGAMLRNSFECSVSFQGDNASAVVTSLG